MNHPAKENRKLGEVCVQPHDTLEVVCAKVEELTGLKKEQMIPIEGIRTDPASLPGYENYTTFHQNFPKINWVACAKDKVVSELYVNDDRFMYSDQLKFARRAYGLVNDAEPRSIVTKPPGWVDTE